MFFASSKTTFNEHTFKLNATLAELRVLEAGKAADDSLETINESESQRESSISSANDEQ